MIKKRCMLFLLPLISAFPLHSFAVGSSGFENSSFSTIQLAQGGAVVAQSEEPAAISYNPAAIADLKGVQLEANSTFISVLTFGKSALTGKRMQSTGTIAPVPTAYATINPGKVLNDKVTFGIGIDSPFGLSDQYPANHPSTKYTGYSNYIKMFTIKPVMAVKPFDWLSLGAGPIYYRTYDLGGVQAYPNCMLPPYNWPDGQVRLNLSGNTWGWQMGALIKPHKKHALGFYFRSPVNMLLKGLGKVENATIGNHFETGVHAKFNLPLNLTFGYAFSPSNKTTLEADFGYTRWSIHKRLYFNADPVGNSNDDILRAIGQGSGNDKDYEDTYSIQLGGKHKFNSKFTLRGGMLFYTAAVPKTHWSPMVADSNRIGWSIGTSYEVFKNMNLDLGYIFYLGLRRSIGNEVGENAVLQNSSVDGRYTSIFQLFSVTLRYSWEGIFDKKSDKKELSKDAAVTVTPKFPINDTPKKDTPEQQAKIEIPTVPTPAKKAVIPAPAPTQQVKRSETVAAPAPAKRNEEIDNALQAFVQNNYADDKKSTAAAEPSKN